MANDNPLNDHEMTLVRHALDAVELTDQILNSNAESTTVSFAEIYAYATDPNVLPSERLMQALSEDGRVRQDFDALLRNTSQYFLPQVAAASSGEISTREIDGCKITFRSSRADADQIFVIIELGDSEARPGALFICPEGRPTEKVALPEPRSGRIQLLFDTESPILRGLRNIDTEVFLR